MRLKDLLRILLINSLFANLVNLLFLAEWTQTIWKNWHYAIILGLVVYGIQAVLIFWLVKPYRDVLEVRKSLSFKSLAVGLSVALLVWIIAQVAATVLNGTHILYPTENRLFKFVVVFLFNTVIGAFYEELIFRFIPIQFCRQLNWGKGQTFLLLLGVSVLFAFTHLSVYLVRDQVSSTYILNALRSPFLFGVLMILVYFATKNLYFIALLHAFDNNGLYLVETPYAFVTVLLVTLLWFLYPRIVGQSRFVRVPE